MKTPELDSIAAVIRIGRQFRKEGTRLADYHLEITAERHLNNARKQFRAAKARAGGVVSDGGSAWLPCTLSSLPPADVPVQVSLDETASCTAVRCIAFLKDAFGTPTPFWFLIGENRIDHTVWRYWRPVRR